MAWLGYLAFTQEARVQFPAWEFIVFFLIDVCDAIEVEYYLISLKDILAPWFHCFAHGKLLLDQYYFLCIFCRPKNNLVLDWVYGCRSNADVSKNLWVLKSGELAYFVSTTVVIYNRYKETQRHYRGKVHGRKCYFWLSHV